MRLGECVESQSDYKSNHKTISNYCFLEPPLELLKPPVPDLLKLKFLISHEFQHKSNYNGVFVGDNDPVGPFATGRDLIDSAAKSVVSIAKRKGKVGAQFGIRDIFDCLVSTPDAHFGARISSSRLFQSEDLLSYETSFGKNPSDGSVYLPEKIDSTLILVFDINEPNNCGDADPLRKTSVQIIRSAKSQDGTLQDSVLATTTLPTNPMCPNADHKVEASADQIKFTCQYFGSIGTTSSMLPFSFARRSAF